MLYRPQRGRIKDTAVFWHAGRFTSFSMYSKDPLGFSDADYRNVWSAESTDGVHWRDVGPVIEDAPFPVWAMSVHGAGDRFVLNHGSFGAEGKQNVIRFWESPDLLRWRYTGPERDLYPDPRCHGRESRLDCMAVVPVAEQGRTVFYGYATGPGGFLRSPDGLSWEGMAQPMIDWCGMQPPPISADEGILEIGGCALIDGRTYLVGGWFNTMGMSGYGTYTLVGDGPRGPFRPDPIAYRLCGNSQRWVTLWARFCRTDGELLVNGYLYDGYSYELGETWLPTLKKAVVDAHRHLRLGYWEGNEGLKGPAIALEAAARVPLFGADAPRSTPEGIEIAAQSEVDSRWRTGVPTSIVMLDLALPVEEGVVVEGALRAWCRDPRLVTPGIGFYLEETRTEGTAIVMEGLGLTKIGLAELAPTAPAFGWEDTVGPCCASPAGITQGRTHRFRLLLRRSMFELYLDDLLVQTFNTAHRQDGPGRTPGRLGLMVQNGFGCFSELRAWRMSLD